MIVEFLTEQYHRDKEYSGYSWLVQICYIFLCHMNPTICRCVGKAFSTLYRPPKLVLSVKQVITYTSIYAFIWSIVVT